VVPRERERPTPAAWEADAVDRAAFTELVREQGNEADVRVLGRIFAWSDQHGLRDTWEPKAVEGDAWVAVMKGIEWEPSPIGVGSSPPRLFVRGEGLRRHHPFRMDKRWQSALDQLYAIPGVVETPKGLSPNILLRDLDNNAVWSPFFQVIEAVMTEVRRSSERNMR
jgi:hypothetical protein